MQRCKDRVASIILMKLLIHRHNFFFNAKLDNIYGGWTSYWVRYMIRRFDIQSPNYSLFIVSHSNSLELHPHI